ncbi:MAG: sensor domain-containing diguanylate cyclase [Halofilum sp. (in: g-proteobacteria)]|nr:sensor domain-containing diguanylate cyclase [Halofilum sp. (in: g-proteobacteria)]
MPYRKLYFAGALTALLVLGFIATSIIGYYVARDSLHDRIADETLPLTSDNIYSEIEQDLLRSVLISSLMAHDTFVRDWTLGGEDDPQKIIRYLQQIQQKYGTTTAFYVSESTRRYYHPEGVLETVEPDDPTDEWYFRVRDLDEPYEINVDQDTADPDRLTIFVNHRVEGYDGDYLGATGVGLSVDAVAKLIESYQQRYGRQIYFIDRDGNVQLRGESYEGADNVRERAGMAQVATKILANPSTAASYTGPNGNTVHVNSRLIPEFDWYLVVEQSGSATETRILNTLMLNIGIALVIAVLVLATAWFTIHGYQARLEQMATTDELTGSANRQVFELLFNQAVRSARRSGSRVSLVALDIDGFKAVNDAHGHAAGDAVIRTLIATARRNIRDTDTTCRWGGDEFLLLLSDCGSEDAARIAENIRREIGEHPVEHGGAEIEVSVSLGTAEHRAGEDLRRPRGARGRRPLRVEARRA